MRRAAETLGVGVAWLLLLAAAAAQQPGTSAPAAAGPLAAQVKQVLLRASDGHSPSEQEIKDAGTPVPQPDGRAVAEAEPELVKALENSDSAVRSYALTLLLGLQQAPAEAAPAAPAASPPPTAEPASSGAAPADGAPAQGQTVAPPPGPVAYRAAVARALEPALGKIAAHLTDELPQNRLLTAAVLGGFTPNPPAAVYPPLLAFLQRDDAVGPTGQAVASDLVTLGPIPDAAASALVRYLRRSDQTSDGRASLIDSIASSQYQSPLVDAALLRFLDSDDPGVRARLILSLPQLDLSPEVFAETRARVTALAGNDQESLQVVNAAKSVTGCWTSVRMASGCPVY